MAKVKANTSVKAASNKGTPKAAATKAQPAPKPAGREVGKSSGVGVCGTWVAVFEQNEKSPKARKLTDEQITATMQGEFPTKDSKVFTQVQLVRTRYNKGLLTKGQTPKVISYRYDENGEKTTIRSGRQPKRIEGYTIPELEMLYTEQAEKLGKGKGGRDALAAKVQELMATGPKLQGEEAEANKIKIRVLNRVLRKMPAPAAPAPVAPKAAAPKAAPKAKAPAAAPAPVVGKKVVVRRPAQAAL